MMIDMRALIVIGVIVGIVGVASAQPGNTPPSAWAPPPPPPATTTGPVAGEKSPGTALALSLGGTALSIALAAADDDSDSDNTLSTIGGIGIWVAPSFGHWYAGKAWTPGLTARFAGAGAVVVGALVLLGDCGFEGSCSDSDVAPGIILIYGGAAAFLGGVVYDIATAPGEARKHNARLREQSAGRQWALTPTLSQDRAGLVFAGRF